MNAQAVRRVGSPQLWTALLSGALLSGAGVLALHSAMTGPLIGRPVLAIAIAITFFVAEQDLVNIEFRRQSHAVTLAGVPLVLGAVLLPLHEFVVARLVGSLIALLYQRVTAEKILYNTSAYCFEAAVTATLVRLAVSHGRLDVVWLSVAHMMALIGIVAAMDQVMSLLVLLVIRLHAGALKRSDVLGVLVPSALLSITATVFGASLVLLGERGVVGQLLCVALIVAATGLYRMYAKTVREHQSLTMVHDFVTGGAGAENVKDVARHSLARIRSVLRASTVELLLLEPRGDDDEPTHDGERVLRLVTDEDDRLIIGHGILPHTDWVRSRALHHRQPTLGVRGVDEATDAWLNSAGLQDALVAPVQVGHDVIGTVTVSDRLTDMATFIASDLRMLKTLASHLAIAIRSAQLMQTLSHQATHDALTGLANRVQLYDRIQTLASSTVPCAVLLLDLDKFKDVNDVLGHEIGDQLLCAVAERIGACTPAEATIARLGGDEFAVLLPDSDAETAKITAQAIVDAVLSPIRFADALVTPEISIGIACGPSVRTEDLLRCADTAMYAAKSGDDSLAVYHADMDLGRAERLALVADLRIALDSAPEQFTLHYQPKIDLHTHHVTSAEALVRWLHPTRGMITPDRFVPLAEATGLIDKLTMHVLTTALRDCAAWRSHGHLVDVAVNLSPRNLTNDNIMQHVHDALEATGASPSWLILEITETVIMQDPARAVRMLTELAEMGISISLDDFGTGYSSLAYLQKLPVHELKIDRSFVADLTSGETANARNLFRSMTFLGTNLSLRLVAEGIETADQLRAVTELGCDTGQGFLISRPLSLPDFRRWLDPTVLPDRPELRLVSSS